MTSRRGTKRYAPALRRLWKDKAAAGRYYAVPVDEELARVVTEMTVVESGGEIVGAMREKPYATMEGYVFAVYVIASEPTVERQLLLDAIDHGRRWGGLIQSWGDVNEQTLQEFAFTQVKTFLRLDRALVAVPTYVLPEGFRLVDYSQGTYPDRFWRQVVNDSFEGTWRAARTVASEWATRTGRGTYQADLELMAIDQAGVPAAVVLCGLRHYQDGRPEPIGEVEVLATLPAYRQKGIATNLMGLALHRLQSRSAMAEVQVDSENPSKRIYEGLGFKSAASVAVWERTATL